MDLDAILFTVIECIVIFAVVYFFFSNIKIRGETRNSYLSLFGLLLYFGLFISLMIGFYYSGSLNDLLLAIMFLQVLLIVYYRKSFDRILLYLGVSIALISDFIWLYGIYNFNQPLIFSYGLPVVLLLYTVAWAIMVVEKRMGRKFSWMEKLSGNW
jgi:hypothetical protein